jgi:DNA-binding transcriptional ArsR family regulator
VTSVDQEPRRLHDPSVLKAISHPLRVRILYELTTVAGARASDLAREIGVQANLVSFHLRQLAKYGLVEEAPELARDKRERVWRVSSTAGISTSLSAVANEPGGEAAIQVWKRESAAWAHMVIDHAYAQDVHSPDIYSISDVPMRLTTAQARELATEITALLRRWVHQGSQVDEKAVKDEPRKTYLALTVLQPYPHSF